MTRLFLFSILFSSLFFACKNEANPTAANGPSAAAYHDAATNIDDLIPRYVFLMATNMVDKKQKLEKISILVDGIGYPTKLAKNDTVFMNIAGLSSESHNFRALLTLADSSMQERRFTATIDENTTEIRPKLEPLKKEE